MLMSKIIKESNTDFADASVVDEDLKKLLEARKANIKVVGIGGAGNNTISRMMQVGIVGVETIAVNTDAQDLLYTDADDKVLIGKELTKGLGAGADPNMGLEAAKEDKDDLKEALAGADLVFITAGMGGGTGTGAASVVADIAKKMGALVVAVVSLPFAMEGRGRMENAKFGLENLRNAADTLIVVPNDKLLEIVPDVSIVTAFKVSDEILVNAVKGIAELITKPGLVNLDFADVKAVMGSGGFSMIGLGESDTENRALESVEKALNNPLLDVDIQGAKGALVNVVGGAEMTIKECQQIVEAISSKLSEDAKVIWGAQIDKELGEKVRAMIVVTGVLGDQKFDDGTITKGKQREIEKILGIDFM
ncbi:MAG: cell division protein FtsZ [Nanoarchaeota archaeon]|nr:cell division protein FtsZ [Nanoarchaeota archaeon]MBU4123964.1 cell division protein FtsZ [Nanoarchaeota archaeon]